jgi:hypothetical protein
MCQAMIYIDTLFGVLRTHFTLIQKVVKINGPRAEKLQKFTFDMILI